MKNVKTYEETISSIEELSIVIKKTLMQCKDTQVFISNALFKRLLHKDRSRIIWEEDVLDGFHYSDKVEKAFIFQIKSETVQMHFAENCLGYKQLTFFASKGVLYKHYLRGMKSVLIINTD